jgi:chemotaxis protein histidine kinase CheA
MSLDETLVFTEDRSSEPEVDGQIRGPAPASRQTKSGDGDLSSENLGNLLRRVSKTSISEVDNLIGELQTLRRRLQADGDRIQRDIAKYAELSQQVMQLTTIISDSVKKLPHGPRIN